ncbi:hypothetical protein EUX98_g1216 [Antrodiella citrinella]|uniref:SET domain-containing protein n=1 Tax=Antrodiella citrinella TaxID=2447956 RepID=A0A4S4N572_9APHY|nr:hypothetical protein EUX98_g1216 [Antrodiella citrinella]
MATKFSTAKLMDLERICISHMTVGQRYEDPEGGTCRLALYHYPFTLNCSEDEADDLFPIGCILAIREPYYEIASDVPTIQVKAPSDITFIAQDSPLVNDVTWLNTFTSYDPKTPDHWKERGVGHFKNKLWFCAAISFSQGLSLDPVHHLLLLNRAETYLRLEWYNSAARDADAVLAMELDDPTLNRKAVVRATKAHYYADRVVQRMWEDPNVGATINTMYAGDAVAVADYPPAHSSSSGLKDPRVSTVDIDILRVEAVCVLNAFRLDTIDTQTQGQANSDERPVALYFLPSLCNHACIPSAIRSFFGDVMVMRASRPLEAGEEITLGYSGTTRPFEERSKVTQEQWGFTCECLLCKADRADSATARQQRVRLYAMSPAQTLAQAQSRLAAMKATYPDTPERQACGIKPALLIAYRELAEACVAECDATFDVKYAVQCAEAIMDGFETVGMVILDRTISGRVGPAALPVDATQPPCAVHLCTPMVLQLVGSLCVLRERVRATNWLKVAIWLEDLETGGGKSLFQEIYKKMLSSLPIRV